MIDVIVTVQHVRDAGMCVRGARQWFTLHGLDFQHFLTHGIPASQVTPLNDAFADKVVALAQEDAQ